MPWSVTDSINPHTNYCIRQYLTSVSRHRCASVKAQSHSGSRVGGRSTTAVSRTMPASAPNEPDPAPLRTGIVKTPLSRHLTAAVQTKIRGRSVGWGGETAVSQPGILSRGKVGQNAFSHSTNNYKIHSLATAYKQNMEVKSQGL